MSKVIKKDRDFIILNLDEILKKKDYFHFKKLINERLKGKPIAYLTGKKIFGNMNFV